MPPEISPEFSRVARRPRPSAQAFVDGAARRKMVLRGGVNAILCWRNRVALLPRSFLALLETRDRCASEYQAYQASRRRTRNARTVDTPLRRNVIVMAPLPEISRGLLPAPAPSPGSVPLTGSRVADAGGQILLGNASSTAGAVWALGIPR